MIALLRGSLLYSIFYCIKSFCARPLRGKLRRASTRRWTTFDNLRNEFDFHLLSRVQHCFSLRSSFLVLSSTAELLVAGSTLLAPRVANYNWTKRLFHRLLLASTTTSSSRANNTIAADASRGHMGMKWWPPMMDCPSCSLPMQTVCCSSYLYSVLRTPYSV